MQIDNPTVSMDSGSQNKPVDCNAILFDQMPKLACIPEILRKLLVFCLRWLINEDRINAFLHKNKLVKDFDFIDQVLLHLKTDYVVSPSDLLNIPAKGRVIIVANHPLGGLDGLILLRLVSRVRPDVRIVVNELLMHIKQLKNICLPVTVIGGVSKKAQIIQIRAVLNNDHAIIIFPSGEVGRAGLRGIWDRKWLTGFIQLAQTTGSPVLPVHINARNSLLFYLVALISQPLSMLMLPREMFGFRRPIKFTIGQPINIKTITNASLSKKKLASLVQEHLWRVGSGKQLLFSTETTIIHPKDMWVIRSELAEAEVLGTTSDNKIILLHDCLDNSVVLDEIGRLRESTFRVVGEGTGREKDIDPYDKYYRHLILWDDYDMEIVGAYRLGEIWNWPGHDSSLLYSSSLFNYSDNAAKAFAGGLELGRSFVQPRYWGKRSLDYLWQGIGAYLAQNPDVTHLFGPVSLSKNLPKQARDLLVYYYGTYYPDPQNLARAKTPYVLDAFSSSLEGNKQDFINSTISYDDLRTKLDFLGVKIPTLLKHYADVCLPGGARFCDFNVDENFAHCVDGLVIVDLSQVKPKKRARYISKHKNTKETPRLLSKLICPSK